jgi:DNA replication ATP-dependent helicase Dna2
LPPGWLLPYMKPRHPMPEKILTPDAAAYFYREITDALFLVQSPESSSILALRAVLAELLHTLTSAEPQLFTDIYSRLVFIADKHSLPDYILREAHAFRRIATKAQRRSRMKTDLATLHSAARGLALLVFFFSDVRAEEPLRTVLLQAKPLTREAASRAATLPLVRCTVQRLGEMQNKHGRAILPIECLSHDGEVLWMQLVEPWHETGQLLWEGATLHISHVRHVETTFAQHDDGTTTETSFYATSPESVVVLEPDYLLDVTDLAECVQRPLPHGGNPRLSLLKKFLPTEAKMSLVGGNVANYCFDALLTDMDANFDTTFRTAILQKPLQIVALEEERPDALAQLRLQASMIFGNIRKMLTELTWDKASIEASFMAPLVGLQGRLDLLLEYGDDPYRKRVIELKAGSPPVNATWENNAAQVTGYNLLLDACFRERSGDSSIFYAQDLTRPLRNVPNDARSKQLLLALRNRIIAQEYAILSRQFKSLRELHPEHFGLTPPYMTDTLAQFAFAFASASSLERKYFQVFTAFVMRENWSTRVGGSEAGRNAGGFAALWRTSLVEKASSYAVLSHLTLDVEASDMELFHLHFHRSEETSALANFRKGDIILLYPMAATDDEDERTFLRGSLAKGYIKSISRERVVVSLRNKLLGENLFSSEVSWAIEPDFMGTEFKSQYESLYEFLRADEARRSLLLGLREPEFAEPPQISYPDLTDEQNERLRRAMSAKDYFLLQGPPGTGKTSRMLKSMARYLFENTDEHVLLLAFTNRAVDEICEALKTAQKDIAQNEQAQKIDAQKNTTTLDFIRLGAKESTTHTERVLYALMEGKSIEEIRALLGNTRIIVSTISSLLKTPELLAIKRFGTVIIDEASQVVEPQLCGLLTKFPRCILIGDEKQLPAVVVQPERGTFTSDAELNEAGFYDLRVSLFERLLTRCKAQGWERAYGIISRQGRMHVDLMRFPNETFYNGVLTPLAGWQGENLLPQEKVEHTIKPLLSQEILTNITQKRLIFWSSEPEQQTKVHEQEAMRAAALALHFREELGDKFHAGSIGIITPFRAQIAAIHRHLAAELRETVSVDTVERYQGSERDIIIISFALNYPAQVRSVQSLSFDGTVDRKLNVALTRARERLVVLGCSEVLQKHELFAKFIGFVRDSGGFVGK